MNVTFPSTTIPGPAPISLQVPDDWQAAPMPTASLLAIAPAIPGHFRPNVVVSHARTAGIASLEEVAAAARAELAELPDFTPAGDDLFGEKDGLRSVVREYAFTDATTGLGLYQVQLQTEVPVEGGVVDLVTLTGTCSGAQIEFVELLRGIVASVSFATA